ncbi:MAG TPA: septum formation family protein [Acidimicrobiia bacterium]
MAESDRKSSEDLIREANQRLRSTPEPEATYETATAPSDEVSPPVTPQGIEYRSQQVSDPAEFPTGPVQTQPEPRIRINRSWVRLILSALVFGGWFLFSTLDDASRDDSGDIADAGDLDVMSLQVGDCFDDPEDLEEVVFDVAAVPCSGPHDNEVFAVQPLGASFGDSYPGDDALSDYTHQVCSGGLFDSYVGTSYVDSSLEVFTFTPTQESWDEGDREFVCALFRLDFAKLTGTARDSGL